MIRNWVILIGILLCSAIGWMGINLAGDFSTGSAIFFFFLITLFFNPLIYRINKSSALSEKELALLYGMLVCACATVMGYAAYFLVMISGPFYFDEKWIPTIVPHLRNWFAVTDSVAIRDFFEGGRASAIPWGLWLKPVFSWTVFFIVLSTLMLFTMILLRRQWEEKERLAYPLTMLPEEMIKSESGLPPIFRNKLFWLGFGIVFLLGCVNGLHNYFPLVPQAISIYAAPRIFLFRRTINLIFRLSFVMLGFGYLINTKLSFSIWILYLITLSVQGMLNISGYSIPETMDVYSSICGGPLFSFLQTGSLLLLVIAGLWRSREHFRQIFSSDTEEIVSPKICLRGILILLVFLSFYLSLMGIRWWVSFLFMVFTLLLFIGITRVVAEGGMAETKTPISSPTFIITLLGSNILGPSSIAILGLNFIWTADTRSLFITSTAHSFKVWGKSKKRENLKLVIALILAMLVTFLVFVCFRIYLGYKTGMLNLTYVPDILSTYNYIHQHISQPKGPFLQGLWFTISGGAITLALLFLYQKFLWWPIHPLGLPVSAIWLTHQIWFSIFIAWLIKKFILRYGGPTVYKKSIPFFLGLITGQFTAAGVWFFIDKFTGSMGRDLIFWL